MVNETIFSVIAENNLEQKDKEENHIVKIKKEDSSHEMIDIIKSVSPGTPLRIAIDDVVKAGNGALIVINSPEIHKIMEGGFRVNTKFTPQKLTELSKMDGAIILSEDMKKILYANTLLVPRRDIPTNETGTRHKAGERTAKQANTVIIAISERRKTITLFYKNSRYLLKSSEEILRRATETLQILEKQKELFDELISSLNVLEVTNLVVTKDVCSILQRIETINRISNIIKRYLIELGKEGTIINLRFKELTKDIEKNEELILKDYIKTKVNKVKQIISALSFDKLLDSLNISKNVFELNLDERLSPRGYRLLSKTNLSEHQLKDIINEFKCITNIFEAENDKLDKLFAEKHEAEQFRQNLNSLKEQIIVGKKI